MSVRSTPGDTVNSRPLSAELSLNIPRTKWTVFRCFIGQHLRVYIRNNPLCWVCWKPMP